MNTLELAPGILKTETRYYFSGQVVREAVRELAFPGPAPTGEDLVAAVHGALIVRALKAEEKVDG